MLFSWHLPTNSPDRYSAVPNRLAPHAALSDLLEIAGYDIDEAGFGEARPPSLTRRFELADAVATVGQDAIRARAWTSAAVVMSPIRADRVARGVCGAWPGWATTGVHADHDGSDRSQAEMLSHETPPGRIETRQSLWSGALTVGAASGARERTGFSIYEGLGALASSGFRIDRSSYSVLSAFQRGGGFVLELAGLDALPGGFTVDVHTASGTRVARLSSCDSVQSSGMFGNRFVWPAAAVHWAPGEAATIAIYREAFPVLDASSERLGQDTPAYARFEDVPVSHAGEEFEVTLQLLDRFYTRPAATEAPSVRITAGVVTELERLPGDGDRWRLTIAPDGRQAVRARLIGGGNCGSTAGACDHAAGIESQLAEIVVPGPPITARPLEVPDHHSGLARVPIQIAFSDAISTSLRNLSRRVLYTNGTPLAGVRRIDDRPDLIEVIMAPDSAGDVEIAIDPAQVCAESHGGCRDDLQRLDNRLEVTIPAATIHLTFDDGPHPVYTPQILDILSYYGAKATFFVTGTSVRRYPELIQRIADEGHTLANHTWNHESLAGLSQAEFEGTINRTQIILGQHATPCIRPPYYSVDEHTAQRAARLSLRLIMGTVRTSDWMLPGAEVIARQIYHGAAPGAVIVLHDGGGDRSQTVEALRSAMWNLRGFNYSFEPVCRPYRPASLYLTPAGAWPIHTSIVPGAAGF
ncbi:MAG: polysaccharide deacetylase family protein [Chloroflexi bacterium]|nr:polysaccharide deacetylase family protein [Chloroflexota bacterium]